MVSAILAGGQNTRFPTRKGLIEVNGSTLIERNIALLRMVSDKVFISTNEPEIYFHFGIPMVGDVMKNSGPMGGIYSLFAATGASEIFVLACDMPFIHIDVIRYIIENRSGQATVPVMGGAPEPLLAVYTRAAAREMEQLLAKGHGSLRKMLRTLNVKYIHEEEFRSLDPMGESFMNINTPEDYKHAFGLDLKAVNAKEV